ncbi:LysE family translocator [Gluconacetobacter aggeris]|uniref:LysE family translocator n=2 Tax=Gluconacetobacter TaxID=89583 RepID=A0A7W4ISA2_9PROT|nr:MULTISPECIES: LysE family translocator [Gluconacetobacter]MBB2168111.1 LysE family translocator [Gluconacetobacter aggeris]MBB2202247.1 LysE family translocator [Gluconacetobacter tumulisoli]
MPSLWDSFGPLAVFVLVTSITPGPNNTMLAASGLNHGFRRTIPQMLGISIGIVVMVALVGIGLGSIFDRLPFLYVALKYISALYLIWLAWKIATSDASGSTTGSTKPLSFLQAAGFQWINPKAWVMAVSIVSAYTPRHDFLFNLPVACLMCGIVSLLTVSLWAGFGASMRRWLTRPTILRGFNIGMALLLLASLYPLMQEATT